MASIFKLKRIWFVLLVIPALILTSLAAKNPDVVERVYSSGIYPWMAGFFGRLTGAVPFSLAQWILLFAVVAGIVYIIVSIIKRRFAKLFATVLCLTGIIWFGFTALCGLNYHRPGFAAESGLQVRPSSAEELAQLCFELTSDANILAGKVARDDNGIMVSSFKDSFEAAKYAPAAYSAAGEKYPMLGGFYTRPKPVIGSQIMSMADLVGVYFPFTFEANVNIDVPGYVIPSAMLHELAHFKGFMREDEANFISYAACVSSGNDDFAYSGIMLALIHSINALYSADRDAYWDVMDSLDKRVLADFKANDEYWRRFEGPVADVSEMVNDVYLKTNRQAAGVKSYGQMVDLLLAEYRQKH